MTENVGRLFQSSLCDTNLTKTSELPVTQFGVKNAVHWSEDYSHGYMLWPTATISNYGYIRSADAPRTLPSGLQEVVAPIQRKNYYLGYYQLGDENEAPMDLYHSLPVQVRFYV